VPPLAAVAPQAALADPPGAVPPRGGHSPARTVASNNNRANVPIPPTVDAAAPIDVQLTATVTNRRFLAVGEVDAYLESFFADLPEEDKTLYMGNMKLYTKKMICFLNIDGVLPSEEWFDRPKVGGRQFRVTVAAGLNALICLTVLLVVRDGDLEGLASADSLNRLYMLNESLYENVVKKLVEFLLLYCDAAWNWTNMGRRETDEILRLSLKDSHVRRIFEKAAAHGVWSMGWFDLSVASLDADHSCLPATKGVNIHWYLLWARYVRYLYTKHMANSNIHEKLYLLDEEKTDFAARCRANLEPDAKNKPHL